MFDLIQGKEGIGFGEAMERAREMLGLKPDEWEPSVTLEAKVWDPDAAARELQVHQEYAHANAMDLAVALDLVVHPAISGEDPARAATVGVRLVEGYGLGLEFDGSVHFPHWNADGVLTGVKIRKSDGSRISYDGSTYEDFYGAWRPRTEDAVALTEGETDHLWLAREFALAGIHCNVYALPRGAGASKPGPNHLRQLQGAKQIFLAFDPDAAGIAATREWMDFLADADFNDVRVCRLPLGKDLRAARPSVAVLLSNARRAAVMESRLAHDFRGYHAPSGKDGTRQITNWWLEVHAGLTPTEPDQDPGFLVTRHHAGLQAEDEILVTDLATKSTIVRWASKRGLNWEGSESDAAALRTLVMREAEMLPEVFMAAHAGLQNPPEGYVIKDRAVALPGKSIGAVPWRYVPGTIGASDVSHQIMIRADNRAGFDWQWIIDFLALSEPGVTQPLLAWLVAAMRRPEVQRFPLLFLSGPSGSGKTTLAEIAQRLAGARIALNLTAETSFTLSAALTSTTSIPVFVDEWTRMSRKDTRETFQGAIPAIYTGDKLSRGRQDLSAVHYPMTAPVMVAGEDTFDLDRALERMVVLNVSRTQQDPGALIRLSGQPIEGIAQHMYSWLTSDPRGLVHSPPPFQPAGDDRPSYNQSCLLEGWKTLLEFADHVEYVSHIESPDFPAQPDLALLNRDETEHVNVYWQALQEASAQTDRSGQPLLWYDAASNTTYVRLKQVVSYAEGIGMELPGGDRAMRAWLRQMYPELKANMQSSADGMRQLACDMIPGLSLYS